MTKPQFRWEDRTVVAALDGRDVGHITVPNIPFHFSRGVCIDLAGISAVGTDQTVRRQGIASAMMAEANRFAVARGYACSAVSTGLGNVARRLYANAGNVHLFSQSAYRGDMADLPAQASPASAHIRPCTDDDEPAVLALIEALQRPYFGTLHKTLQWFHNLHHGRIEDSPAGAAELVAFVAERGGEIVSYCSRVHSWSGSEAELFVRDEDPDLSAAMLRTLADAVAGVGEEYLRFSVSECQRDMLHFLWARGFRPEGTHVFMFNIIDLQQLLHQLAPLFDLRLTGIEQSGLPEALTIRYPGQSGALELGGPAPPLLLEAGRDVITQVICGTISAWEAYLRGILTIEPRPSPEAALAIQAILPAVPYQHPAVDRW